ncbi:hypothetical protein OE88DRAFT_172508 [Heliocybe sulcata]|uniref:Uncharacterized protein n=1 Tax=Heliocybe sulcata TaxID=5364 RepID=A0A5C3N116_9AGAM|nr:hypothetical protein OE88DRAFT_172508 [Heliocybe sulcata]
MRIHDFMTTTIPPRHTGYNTTLPSIPAPTPRSRGSPNSVVHKYQTFSSHYAVQPPRAAAEEAFLVKLESHAQRVARIAENLVVSYEDLPVVLTRCRVRESYDEIAELRKVEERRRGEYEAMDAAKRARYARLKRSLKDMTSFGGRVRNNDR